MSKRALMWVVASLLWPSTTRAELTLTDVLHAVAEHHPSIEAARQDVLAADAQRTSARGAWDPKLSLEARVPLSGYYDGSIYDAEVSQNTPLWGTRLEAGYRLGRGAFPLYKGEYQTTDAGEVRAGAAVPLLRGGAIDERRANISVTRERARAARCERDTTVLDLQADAVAAYERWVAAGRELQIQRHLLEVATERDDALQQQVLAGSIPALAQVDNRRAVLERQAKLVAAEQYFVERSIGLSLYLRDDAGRPVRATEPQLPGSSAQRATPGGSVRSSDEQPPWLPTESVTPPTLRPLADDVRAAAASRPELCALERELRAAGIAVELADNQLSPSLDASILVARDLGDGPAELRDTEVFAGVRFELPIGLHQARGEHAAMTAKRRALEAKLRALRDAVAADVQSARVRLRASHEQWQLARQYAELGEQLASAERERFTQGATDLVVVNLRELQAAEAQRLAVEALANYRIARAQYQLALGRTL